MKAWSCSLSKLVQQWFLLARKDQRNAEFNWTHQNKNDCKELVAFLSQQCAEKSIKGLMQYHKIKIDKTHDLAKLSFELLKIYPELDSLLNQCASLSPYAVIIRYPDALDIDLKTENTDVALKIATEVYKMMCSKVPFGSGFDA